MITANCRDSFTARDFDFVVETLAKDDKDSCSLVELLTDAETRDEILDHPKLFARILEDGAPVHISPHLYFYVLTRHAVGDRLQGNCSRTVLWLERTRTGIETKRANWKRREERGEEKNSARG